MENVKTFFGMLKKIYLILNRNQRMKCVILLLNILLTAILEMLGVGVVLPFILAMLEPSVLREYEFVTKMAECLNLGSDRSLIFFTAVLIIIVYFIKNIIIMISSYISARIKHGIEKDVAMFLLTSYMRHPYQYFLNTNSAKIVQVVNQDSFKIAEIIDAFMVFFTETTACFLIAVMLVVINPIIAVELLFSAGIIALGMILFFKRKISYSGNLFRTSQIKRNQLIFQMVNGIKEVSVLQRKESFMSQYGKSAEDTRKSHIVYVLFLKAPSRITEALFIASILIIVLTSLNGVDGAVLISQLGTVAMAGVRILPAISTITTSMNSIMYHRPALESAYENIMEAASEGQTTENSEFAVSDKEPEKTANRHFKDKLLVDNISWHYGAEKKWILKDLSLEILPGQSIAFIGESGAGKTTLADVILGLLKPQQGTVTMDGIDVFDMPKRWSELVGYVPQTPFMIDDTIKRNVAFGIREEDIDEKRIWDALEQAQIRKFVESLPDKLDAEMGERGIRLSGGQRQRIAIARALYNNPEILVLDEATSALDTETETAVMESIDVLKGKKTLIIVAHRLSTIRNCDKIYEIKGGIVVEREKCDLF